MKKITTLAGSLALAVVLGFAATVNAGHEPGHDTCELGAGNEAGDIYNLAAAYDAANDLIVVEILLYGGWKPQWPVFCLLVF